VALAGISLAPIMESWDNDKRDLDALLAGRTPYDEAQIRQDIQRCVESSSLVARDGKKGTAEARDFASRFGVFANDSRTTLGTVSQPSALRMSFNRMVGDCQSCHAIYKCLAGIILNPLRHLSTGGFLLPIEIA
jgi:cytochrome c556